MGWCRFNKLWYCIFLRFSDYLHVAYVVREHYTKPPNGSLDRFPAHRCVLGVLSEVFSGLLISDAKVVQIRGLQDSGILSELLNFIYTGNVTLKKETVSLMLKMAKFLSINSLLKLCKEYFILSHEALQDDEVNDLQIKLIDEEELTKQDAASKEALEASAVQEVEPDESKKAKMKGPKTIVSVTRHSSKVTKKKSREIKAVFVSCEICAATFKNKVYLNRHMAVHSGKRKHCCTTCGKLFLKLDHLARHELTHSTERPFACETCGKKFKTKNNLQRHLLVHTEERPFCCEICAKAFKDNSGLIAHQKSHSRTEMVCDQCGKSFTQRNRLEAHMQLHIHPRKCQVCGKTFKFHAQLRRHAKTHSGVRPFSCEDCGRQFIDAHSLKTHRKKHTGLGLHTCPHCKKEFLDKYHLGRHMKTHTGEKPFKCDVCEKSFSRADNCEIHKKGCAEKMAKRKQIQAFKKQEGTQVKKSKDRGRKILLPVKIQPLCKYIVRNAEEVQKTSDDIALGVDSSEINGRRFQRIAKKPPELKLILLKKAPLVTQLGTAHQISGPGPVGQPALIRIVHTSNAENDTQVVNVAMDTNSNTEAAAET